MVGDEQGHDRGVLRVSVYFLLFQDEARGREGDAESNEWRKEREGRSGPLFVTFTPRVESCALSSKRDQSSFVAEKRSEQGRQASAFCRQSNASASLDSCRIPTTCPPHPPNEVSRPPASLQPSSPLLTRSGLRSPRQRDRLPSSVLTSA